MLRRGVGATAVALALSACVGGAEVPQRPTSVSSRPAPSGPSVVPPRPYMPPRVGAPSTPMGAIPVIAAPGAATAFASGVVPGPAPGSLPIDADKGATALAAFRLSCPSLVRRADQSGLTRPGDWKPACDAAASVAPKQAGDFFRRWFEPVQVGDGRAFATGYFIPEIRGSRTPREGYAPIYARPDDLVDVDLGQFSDALKGKKIRGRVQGSNFVPYYDRTAIEEGSLQGKAKILGYAADPVELFFLQVQGSGLVQLEDGSLLRIGYATQNGRDYTGIGALMKQRGLLAPGQTSMQGIVAYLHAHPEEGRAIMRENKSYVFFRVLDGEPLGALGLPVVGGATVAADPKFIPLGAPVFLSMDRADANGIWIAQDTGGAIKGANRVDTFWGAGDEARAIAGGMSARGTAFLLLPVGTTARLQAQGSGRAGASSGVQDGTPPNP